MPLHLCRWLIVIGLFVLLILPVQQPVVRAQASDPLVLINEFFPGPNTTSEEWIELFNPHPFAVNLSGLRIDDETIGGTQISVPDGQLESNGLLVVARSGNIFNASDIVQILDASNQVLTSQSYTDAHRIKVMRARPTVAIPGCGGSHRVG